MVSFAEPRAVSVLPLGAADDETIAFAVARSARRDATVVLDVLRGADLHPDPAPLARAIAAALPGAEILVADPDEILRFLWYFRDRDDPLALGHAAARDLFDFTWRHRQPPHHREIGGPGGREPLLEVRSLLLSMGNALGVRPPIPVPNGRLAGWSPRRVADLADAVLALYAGLLHRWGAPIMQRRPRPGRPPELRVAAPP